MIYILACIGLYLVVQWVRATIDRGTRRVGKRKRRKVTRRAAGPVGPTPREVLGVEDDASFEEIQVAYRKLALAYHPDRVAPGHKEIQELAGVRLREINAAYTALLKEHRGR